jgi:hypothetical protein
VVDARNLYDPARMRALGFAYQSIGRGHAPPARRGDGAGTDAPLAATRG